MRRGRWQPTLALLLVAGIMTGCSGGRAARNYAVATGGYASSGRDIVQLRCGQCHTVPNVTRADGVFGPPLAMFARRTLIAGQFPNTPENLVPWIMSPKSMKPATAMPELGLSEQQARDVAAFLYTLR